MMMVDRAQGLAARPDQAETGAPMEDQRQHLAHTPNKADRSGGLASKFPTLEVADTAFEGTLLEAETRVNGDVQALVRTVEEAAGVRLQLGEGGLKQIRESPQDFRRMIPRLVESGLGARVWGGLVQLAEARLGESVGLEGSLATPIDWDAAETRLLEAVDQTWARRNDATIHEIEQELVVQLPEGGPPGGPAAPGR
jgi:hypothetical protein